jgi:hypothetical protein
MYARVATFEGDAASFDASLEEIAERHIVRASRRRAGDWLPDAARPRRRRGAGQPSSTPRRTCARGDEALNAMNPAGDSPMRRVSVKKYEVPVKFGL